MSDDRDRTDVLPTIELNSNEPTEASKSDKGLINDYQLSAIQYLKFSCFYSPESFSGNRWRYHCMRDSHGLGVPRLQPIGQRSSSREC